MKMRVKTIVEVVGKPKEHVEKSIKLLIENMRGQESIKVHTAKVYKPKPVENYFSSFAEFEVDFMDAADLVDFCFDYMPSSVEIVEPDSLSLDTHRYAEILNDLLARLHSINLQLTNMKAEKELLQKNAEGLLKNILMLALKSPAPLEEIAAKVGIKPKNLKPFLDKYIQSGHIKQEGQNYALAKSLYGEQKQG